MFNHKKRWAIPAAALLMLCAMLTACGAEAIAGVAKTQASKRALSERERTASNWTYLQRSLAKSMMRADGHRGLSGFTHEWLASFKHNEMGGG